MTHGKIFLWLSESHVWIAGSPTRSLTSTGVGRHEDEELEEEEVAMYAAAAAAAGAGGGGGSEEGAEEAIVDWRHEEKLFDERHYLTGLLWNVQMYIDGYCPDYQFAYRCVRVGAAPRHHWLTRPGPPITNA